MTNATPPSIDEARAVVSDYLDSFAEADPARTAAFVAKNFVNEHTAGLGTGCTGRAVYEERLGGFLSDMVGLAYVVEHLVADVSATDAESVEVAAFYTMSASWQGEAPFEIRGAQRLTVRDGLITHRTDYWDSAVFLCQVDKDAKAALTQMGITEN